MVNNVDVYLSSCITHFKQVLCMSTTHKHYEYFYI